MHPHSPHNTGLPIRTLLQAVANRRERQAAELAGIFDMLTEVDALANNISDQAGETRKMMQVWPWFGYMCVWEASRPNANALRR